MNFTICELCLNKAVAKKKKNLMRRRGIKPSELKEIKYNVVDRILEQKKDIREKLKESE